MHPQPQPFTVQLLVDFCEIFSPNDPSNFLVHDSPCNLAESVPSSRSGKRDSRGSATLKKTQLSALRVLESVDTRGQHDE